MNSPLFNRNSLKIKPLKVRKHDIDINIIKSLDPVYIPENDEKIKKIAKQIITAKANGSSIILMMGGHVIRSGIQNYLVDLMKMGYISCLSMNGSCIIHDFEYALIGATTESVAHYIKKGEFGLWKETGYINDIINEAYQKDNTIGLGEAVSKAIAEGDYPHKNISILASAWKLNVPVTVHVGIGQDIIHEHPNCDGAATGALSYNDFLKYTAIIQKLEHGVVMNFGSSVMAPEVYLKALSMARNIAHQEDKQIKHFTILVCDLHDLPEDYSKEPPKANAAYYFRPWKTMLARTVADGGESIYIKGRHEKTIPAIWTAINDME